MDDPTSAYAYTCSSLLLVASTMLVISLESLFMKNLPRDIRGAMTILLTFFLGLGALLFHSVGGPIFDSMGPASPFVLVSFFDAVLCAFAIILGAIGLLTYANSAEEAVVAEPENSYVKEDPEMADASTAINQDRRQT